MQGGSFAAGWVGGAVSGAFTGAGLGAGAVILGEAFGAAASAGSISAAFGKSALLASAFGGIPGALNGSSIVTKNAVTITYETVFDFFASALTGSN
jgi:hypothetical protein